MSHVGELPDAWGERSADWHFEKFVEFIELKRQVGEPSPHLTMVGYFCKDYPLIQKVWMIGCYGATYSLPSTQVLYYYWSWDEILEGPANFQSWLTKHWDGFFVPTERRTVRTPDRLGRCLIEWTEWMRDSYPKLPRSPQEAGLDDKGYYDLIFNSVTTVWSIGRYIAIRIIEGLRRYADLPAMLYDVRSVGGWSPKKALAYLYPEYVDFLLLDDSESNRKVDLVVEELLLRVQEVLPWVNSYILAAMLCEYKGAYENRVGHPGHTIDEELVLHDKIVGHWGHLPIFDDFWESRKALFPKEVLGELNGWSKPRPEPVRSIRDWGYNWSDLLYDYNATKDFTNPVRRK